MEKNNHKKSNNSMKEFREGLRDGIPICLGYAAVCFAFGISASDAGLRPYETALMSVMNLTSTGQFAALPLITTGATFMEMAAMQLIINLRYVLMSCALTQNIRPETSIPRRLSIAYGVTDEIFALSVSRKYPLNPAYTYGLVLISAFGWTAGGFFGTFAGDILPHRLTSCLGLAIYGMFLKIILSDARESRVVSVIIMASMGMSCLFTYSPVLKSISPGFRVIIVTLAVSAVASLIVPYKGDDTPAGDSSDTHENINIKDDTDEALSK
ncbi:MAG: AzlC family ABC transporter permease [Lachnospiraceae bacterium]|nr:AzlC family ABC transporter permease [Lachnospiraceae bacterium]